MSQPPWEASGSRDFPPGVPRAELKVLVLLMNLQALLTHLEKGLQAKDWQETVRV